jgi:hypothetical protein
MGYGDFVYLTDVCYTPCRSHCSKLSSVNTWLSYDDIFPFVTTRKKRLLPPTYMMQRVCTDSDHFKAPSAKI